MASNTRTVTGLGTVFDFTTQAVGTISFFCNDLNISFNITMQTSSVGVLRLHTGPILFITTNFVGRGARIVAAVTSIGSAFPPPQGLSLLQLQTDTIPQSPTAEEEPRIPPESDPWDQS